MSQLSTIAHPSAPQPRGLRFVGVGLIATALFLGAAIGVFATINWPDADRQEHSSAVGSVLTRDEFIRINTTDLERPPAPVSVTESPTAVDPSGSIANEVSDHFLELNIYSLEYPRVEKAEQRSGPR